MESLTFFDWLFILSAVLFNLLIAAIFIAQKFNNEKLTKRFGFTWLVLFFPLAAVLVNYIIQAKPSWVLVCLGVTLVYMVVEFLLDYVFKYDFRAKWLTHVPYILLEYAALFCLPAVAIEINPTLGWVVSACFWILMGSLIYLYTGKRKQKNA